VVVNQVEPENYPDDKGPPDDMAGTARGSRGCVPRGLQERHGRGDDAVWRSKMVVDRVLVLSSGGPTGR